MAGWFYQVYRSLLTPRIHISAVNLSRSPVETTTSLTLRPVRFLWQGIRRNVGGTVYLRFEQGKRAEENRGRSVCRPRVRAAGVVIRRTFQDEGWERANFYFHRLLYKTPGSNESMLDLLWNSLRMNKVHVSHVFVMFLRRMLLAERMVCKICNIWEILFPGVITVREVIWKGIYL